MTRTLTYRTCAIGIGRQVDFTAAKPRDYSDTPYAMLPVIIFSGVEPSVAVALACVPLMRPLFFAMRPNGIPTESGEDHEIRTRRGLSIARPMTRRYTGDPISFSAPDLATRSSRALLLWRTSDLSAESASYGRAVSQVSTQTSGRYAM